MSSASQVLTRIKDTLTSWIPTVPKTLAPRQLLLVFLVTNLSLVVIFWLIRIPITNEEHFAVAAAVRRAPLRPVSDALYLSLLTQTTVGASDIVPLSGAAQALTALQAAAGIASIGMVAVLAVSSHTS